MVRLHIVNLGCADAENRSTHQLGDQRNRLTMQVCNRAVDLTLGKEGAGG